MKIVTKILNCILQKLISLPSRRKNHGYAVDIYYNDILDDKIHSPLTTYTIK